MWLSRLHHAYSTLPEIRPVASRSPIFEVTNLHLPPRAHRLRIESPFMDGSDGIIATIRVPAVGITVFPGFIFHLNPME